MTALNCPVAFPVMARKKANEETDQVNFRLRVTTLERMERFREQHPLRPTLTSMVEAAMAAWLDCEEPKLDSAKRDRPRR